MKKLIACLALTGVLLASLPLGALAAEPVPPVDTAPGTVLLTPEETAPEAPAAPETPAPEVPAAPEETPAPPEAPAPEAPAAPEEPAAPAPQAEEDDSLMYVALGDSIAAGVGLKDVVYLPAQYGYDMTPNFKGYSPDCYVSVVAEGLGLDSDHAINLGLPALMQSYHGLVLGISAGSMNAARIVYALPEEPGEATDHHFSRWMSGLGLTDTRIYPHYQCTKDFKVDGKNLLEMGLADCIRRPVFGLPDGSYILCADGHETLYGEAWYIGDGRSELVNENGQVLPLR